MDPPRHTDGNNRLCSLLFFSAIRLSPATAFSFGAARSPHHARRTDGVMVGCERKRATTREKMAPPWQHNAFAKESLSRCFVSLTTNEMEQSLEELGVSARMEAQAAGNGWMPTKPAMLPIASTVDDENDPFQGRIMSPLEAWLLSALDSYYMASQKLKCPFFRRRCGDALDNVEAFLLEAGAVRKCFVPVLQRCRPVLGAPDKTKNLPMADLLDAIRRDWTIGKGYYIHGKLSTHIYRDECEFSGPDPDMPVVGLRKYLGVAPLLFDQKKSWTKLHRLEIASSHEIRASWTMRATLRLPWRPELSEWSGTTTYHVGEQDGLIYRHVETWDLTVWQAFMEILPWKKKSQQTNGTIAEHTTEFIT